MKAIEEGNSKGGRDYDEGNDIVNVIEANAKLRSIIRKG